MISFGLILIFAIHCNILCFKSVWSSVAKNDGYSETQTLIEGYRFLSQFGYMAISTNNKEDVNSLRSSSSLREAVEDFQRTFRLPITGRLDNATMNLISSPRCGNKDVHRTSQRRYRRYSFDGKSMWSKKELTYKIISLPYSGLTRKKVHSIFRKAFNIWSKVADLYFTEETDYGKLADIMISFGRWNHGDSIPFDGPGKVLAHAYFPTRYETGFSRSGDAHFDDDEIWTDGKSDGKNLLAVAVHELGHSLGLGHSLVTKAIMFPYYNPASEGIIDLDTDDINGIQRIYGKGDPNKVLPDVPHLPDEIITQPVEPTTSYANSPGQISNVCDTAIDTVILVRGIQLYIFKGEWCWRVRWSRLINDWHSYELRDPPFSYRRFWIILERIGITTGIDAMFEQKDQLIYVFKRRRFWMLINNEQFHTGSDERGQALTELGLPGDLEKIDTMFRWGYNKAIYIFAGELYWKFKEDRGRFGKVEPSPKYPRYIQLTWQNVPTPVDAAYTGLNGQTYFIKDKMYYAFNDYQMRVHNGYPRPSRVPWLGCTNTAAYQDYSNSSTNIKIYDIFWIMLISLILLNFFHHIFGNGY